MNFLDFEMKDEKGITIPFSILAKKKFFFFNMRIYCFKDWVVPYYGIFVLNLSAFNEKDTHDSLVVGWRFYRIVLSHICCRFCS